MIEIKKEYEENLPDILCEETISYFIITQNHGGELTVESQPGKGSKFIIRLPLDRKQFEVGK